jgi:hypothetical protein
MLSAHPPRQPGKQVAVDSSSLFGFYLIRIVAFIPAVVVTWYHFFRQVEVEYIAYFLILPLAFSLALSDFRFRLDETSLIVFKQNFYGRLFTQYTTFDRKEIQDIRVSRWEYYPYPNFYLSGRRRYRSFLDITIQDSLTQDVVRSRFQLVTHINNAFQDVVTSNQYPSIHPAVEEIRKALGLEITKS